MANAIQLTANLYDARDRIRRFWAGRYAEKIAQGQQHIKALMEKEKCDALQAAMLAVRRLQELDADSGLTQTLILAAYVEMVEPSAA